MKITKAMKAAGIVKIKCQLENFGGRMKKRAFIAVIDPRLLSANPTDEYQRDIDEKHSRKIAADFIPHAFGLPLCNWRDGQVWFQDGNHRRDGVLQLEEKGKYKEVSRMDVILHMHLTFDEESDSFAIHNGGRKRMQAWDTFKARRRRYMERTIITTAHSLGLSLPQGLTPGREKLADLRSTKSLYSMARKSRSHLKRCLLALKVWAYSEVQLDRAARHQPFQCAFDRFVATDCQGKSARTIANLFRDQDITPCDVQRRAQKLALRFNKGPKSEGMLYLALRELGLNVKPTAEVIRYRRAA